MRRNRCLLSRVTAALALTAAAALTAGLAACAGVGTSSTKLDSAEFPVRLAPEFTTLVYVPYEDTQADVYLTDLPDTAFDDPIELARSSGQLAHVRMFLRPRAGRTPIDSTACSAAVTWFILAEGRVGVYTGGGFLSPRGKPGGQTFSGSMSEGTLRLYARGPGFVDQIGSGELDLSFRAVLDKRTAEELRRTADRLALTADPLPENAVPDNLRPLQPRPEDAADEDA